ncbi:MAG: GumC family protein [Agriterribacter sp.]
MQESLSSENYSNTNSEENIFHDVVGRYLPYWPLFVGLTIIGVIGAWIYLRYTPPTYESTASLLIKDDKQNLPDGSLMETLDLFGTQKILENEIEILSSRSIAKEVVKKLHLYAPIKQDGRVNDISAYLISPVEVEVQDPEQLKAGPSKKISFKYDPQNKTVLLNEKSYLLNQWIVIPEGTVRFLPNPYHINDSLQTDKPLYFTLNGLKRTVTSLLKSLTVAASGKQSSVINLTYTDAVPKRSENILNEIIAEYNRAAINDKNQLAANTLSFVDSRLTYVVGELDSVERNLAKFKTTNRIVDVSEQGKLFLQNVGANDQKVGELNMQLAVLEQVEKYVKNKSNSGAIVPSTVGISDPVLSRLLENLYNLESQYGKMKLTTAENNSLLISVRDQIEKMRPEILENIQNQKAIIQASVRDVSSTSDRYASLLQTLPIKERQLLDISRQQSIKNSIYTFLLQKREEAALSYASVVSDSRIIDVAESTEDPVSPKKMMVLALALAAAFAASIGFVEAKNLLNRNVTSRSEVEKYTQYPILGEIVHSESGSDLVISEGKRSFIAEQFRQLRTSLGYLGINSRKKKILITSSIPGEGKSFISANLGVSLALIGKKVVLIELDLRKPKLSDVFGVSRQIGISNYFVSDNEAEEIIKSTEVPNLFIVPSGPVPPNPSELILNGRMKELLVYLENHFDYILIDSAPVNPVTDAFIISPMCDASLFVLRDGYTPKALVQKLHEHNRIKGLKNMAIIYNGVKKRAGSSYGSGYGYGYGYGYLEDDNKESKVKKKFRIKI